MKEYFCTQKAIPKELPKKKQKKLDTSWQEMGKNPAKSRQKTCDMYQTL